MPTDTCEAPDATSLGSKCCARCGHVRPLEEFRRRAKDSNERREECNDCHRVARRNQLRRRRRRHVARSLTEIARHRDRPDRVRALTNALIAKLGGIDRASDFILDILEREDTPPASRVRGLIAFLAIAGAASSPPSSA